jgi:hypothetical protein
MMPADEVDIIATANPILEEIWKVRAEHAARFQYD